MWWNSIGNPYRARAVETVRRSSVHRTRRFWLRFRRFGKRRGLVLVFSFAAIVLLEEVHFSNLWEDELRVLYAVAATFMFGNEFRFAWILGKKRALRPVDWSYHWELASSFTVAGIKIGALYPCLCSSLSGEPMLKDYLEVAAFFGTPLLITAIFVCTRRTPIAVTLSALVVTTLWALHPTYAEWIH